MQVADINERIIEALDGLGIAYRVSGELRRSRREKAVLLFEYQNEQNWQPYVFDDRYEVQVFHLPDSGEYESNQFNHANLLLENYIVIAARTSEQMQIVLDAFSKAIDPLPKTKMSISRDEMLVWERFWQKEAPHPFDWRTVAINYAIRQQLTTNFCEPLKTVSCEIC